MVSEKVEDISKKLLFYPNQYSIHREDLNISAKACSGAPMDLKPSSMSHNATMFCMWPCVGNGIKRVYGFVSSFFSATLSACHDTCCRRLHGRRGGFRRRGHVWLGWEDEGELLLFLGVHGSSGRRRHKRGRVLGGRRSAMAAER